MEYSKNLGLALPSDGDLLEISKLSDNFRALDELGVSDITAGMKVGDIVYSTRNLEEESGGVLIACDQRTIDLDAYPDLPRKGLFWPYAELVFNDPAMTTAVAEIPVPPPLSDANTDEWIYTNACYLSGDKRSYVAAAYSLTERKFYRDQATASGSTSTRPLVLRLSENELLMRNIIPAFATNDLQKSGTARPADIVNALQVAKSAIARIDDARFFMVVFADVSSVVHGFYTTDDGFMTLRSISAPATAAADISAARFDQTGNDARANSMLSSPHYPIHRMSNGEMLVTFAGAGTTASISTNETTARNNIKKCIPTVWRTEGGCASISPDTIGGQPLLDWLFEKASAFEVPSTSYTKYLQIAATARLPLDGRYLLRADLGHYYSDKHTWTDSYFILVDLETDEFKVSERYDHGDVNDNVIRLNAPQNLLYRKDENMLYSFQNSNTPYVIDLGDLTISTLQVLDGTGSPQAYPNYMPSATAVAFTNKYDRRLQERGIQAMNTTALCILTEDMDTMDFSSLVRPAYITNGGASSPYARQPYPAPIAAANLTEYHGDLYWGQNGSLYKIPLRNKRQLPYIKNGYIKALNG